MVTPAPYQRVRVCGLVLFAACGANIHSFSLASGHHLSSWRWSALSASHEPSQPLGTDAAEALPSKKRRVASTGGTLADYDHLDRSKDQKTAPQPKREELELPMITLLACTTNGKYLVAIASHNKAVHVLEHDGNGNLIHLSNRCASPSIRALMASSPPTNHNPKDHAETALFGRSCP